MQVVARLEVVGDAVERVVERGAVERQAVEDDRPVGDAAHGETRRLFAGDRRASDDGEIAVTSRELAEGIAVAGPAARHDHRLDQFVICARGRHQAGEERVGRHAALSSAARQDDFAGQREEHQRDFGARIGVGDRAADGAAAARLGMADEGQGARQQRLRAGKLGPGGELRLAHRGADADGVARGRDNVEPGNAHDVDDDLL